MILAENIVEAYNARSKAESWAAWAAVNKTMSGILSEIEVLMSK